MTRGCIVCGATPLAGLPHRLCVTCAVRTDLANVTVSPDALAIRLLRKLRTAAESFVDVVDRAERAATQKGGQQAPYHDDFASVPPSTRRELRWWAERFREATK